MAFDPKKLAEDLLTVVREWVQPAFKAFTESVEARFADFTKTVDQKLAAVPAGDKGDKGDQGDKGERGDDGEDGRDVDPEEVRTMVRAAVDQTAAALTDQLNAKLSGLVDASLPEIREALSQELRQFAESMLPQLKGDKGDAGDKGDKGDAGDKGERGEDGKDVDPEHVARLVADVRTALEASLPEMVERARADITERFQEAARTVRDQVQERLVAYIDEQLPSLKGEAGDKGDRGDQGDKGDAGKDADPEIFRKLVAETVEHYIATARSALSAIIEQDLPRAREQLRTELRGYIDEIAPSLKGDTGDKGDAGDRGNDGNDGESAYQLAVDEGFEGSKQDWLASLHGKDGDKGDKGDKGERGDDGKGVELDDVRSMVETSVRESLDSIQLTTSALEQRFDVVLQSLRDGAQTALRDYVNEIAPSLKGDRGEDGRDADPAQIREAVAEVLPGMVERAREELRGHIDAKLPELRGDKGDKGDQGDKGERGNDADPEQVRTVVAEVLPDMVARAREMLQEHIDLALPGLKGDKGDKGDQGDKGERGAAADPEETAAQVQRATEAAADGIVERVLQTITDDRLPAMRDALSGELRRVLVEEIAPTIKGDKGDKGDRGDKGDGGDRGERGLDGLSAYEIAREHFGFKGTELEWLQSQRGKDGDNGRDGRDALELDIRPAIDPAKAYARGTFARYSGALVRAFRETDPFGDVGPVGDALSAAGWEVIVDTFTPSIIQGDDLRTFTFRFTGISGKTLDQSFALPVLIHRGVYRADQVYTRGDTVTSDGSMWHCIVERTTERPREGHQGEATAWKLAVKRGNHGRPGDKGDKGDKGERGDKGDRGPPVSQGL